MYIIKVKFYVKNQINLDFLWPLCFVRSFLNTFIQKKMSIVNKQLKTLKNGKVDR